jgi:hypothetical protein
VTAIGKTWCAVLGTDMRGPVVTRRANTREGAFAMARRLLNEAEAKTWAFGRGWRRLILLVSKVRLRSQQVAHAKSLQTIA